MIDYYYYSLTIKWDSQKELIHQKESINRQTQSIRINSLRRI